MQTSPTAKGDSVLMNIMYDPSPAPLKYNAFLEIVSKKLIFPQRALAPQRSAVSVRFKKNRSCKKYL